MPVGKTLSNYPDAKPGIVWVATDGGPGQDFDYPLFFLDKTVKSKAVTIRRNPDHLSQFGPVVPAPDYFHP